MPGLRHAHTLQQLKMFIEYSPPGECSKETKENPNKKQQRQQRNKELRTHIIINPREGLIIIILSCCSV